MDGFVIECGGITMNWQGSLFVSTLNDAICKVGIILISYPFKSLQQWEQES